MTSGSCSARRAHMLCWSAYRAVSARTRRPLLGRRGPDEDGRPRGPWTARPQLHVTRRVVLALEVDVALAQQRTDDPERLLEPVAAVVEGHPQARELGGMPAGAEAQDQPAVADLIERVGLLGDERRVAIAHAQHEGAQLHPMGDRGDGGQECPRLPEAERRRVARSIQQMVRQPDRGIAKVLGRDGLFPDVAESGRRVGRRRAVCLRDTLIGRDDDADTHAEDATAARRAQMRSVRPRAVAAPRPGRRAVAPVP